MKLNYKQHLTMMKSTQEDCIAPSRKSKHINESERQQIEHWRLKGVSVAEIAMLLQRHRSTIYRELKRGTVINKRSDLSEFSVYRAQRAQDDYTRNSGAGGPYLKLSWDSKEAKRL
ncbi:MAG: helix-turn-helix domain-containing protein [Ruminococcus sp.]|nr:helix-turn-helix domain-containing protein [Ruminococcus sp.]